MKTILLIFVCLTICFLYACRKSPEVLSLPADKFEELITDERIQLIDVRTVAEYSEGHLPGAININIMDEQFNKVAYQLLSADVPVAVYCKSGRRSKKAAQELLKAGYQVYDLDKGIQGWKKAGKSIVK